MSTTQQFPTYQICGIAFHNAEQAVSYVAELCQTAQESAGAAAGAFKRLGEHLRAGETVEQAARRDPKVFRLAATRSCTASKGGRGQAQVDLGNGSGRSAFVPTW
jgi:hypothetical protein